MARCIFLIWITLLWTSSLRGQYDICKIADSERSYFQKAKRVQQAGLHDNYDVKYHRISLEIDPSVRFISGKVLTIFEAGDIDMNRMYFDISSELTVDSVVMEGGNISYFHQVSDLLKVGFKQDIPAHTVDSLTVYYHGVPPQTGLGSFVQAQHEGVPVIWTLSEPFGAKDWWPCKQTLEDKIDSLDVFVTCPAGNKVAGQGSLVSVKSLPDSRLKYHWKHGFPIPSYLVAVAVTNYSAFSHFVQLSMGSMEILNYVYPEDSLDLYPPSSNIISLMEFMDTLIGPYPYVSEKYGHAQFSWGGGMEHTTMSFMANFDFGLMAHELAHQWFGDKITCGSWKDIWLNEGFATYFTGLSYKYLISGESWKEWKRRTRDHVTSQSWGKVKVDDTTDVNRIFDGRLSYDKGAMLLHMLRWELGDEVFFQAIRNYISDPVLSFSFAKTADLKRHLEKESGTDLSNFFDDWYYGQGHPVYHVQWEQDNEMRVLLSQRPSHPSAGFFEMSVPIRFTGSSGDTTIVFDHISSKQIFTADIDFAVDSIAFDPEIRLLAQVEKLEKVSGIHLAESEEKPWRIYPNPASYVLKAEGNWKTLEIYDLTGRKVGIYKQPPGKDQAYHIDVSSFPNGVYIARSGETTTKFVINQIR